jgi:DNA topoisomerase I
MAGEATATTERDGGESPARRRRVTIVERLQAEGIRRLGTPKRGFRYRTPAGRRPSAADLERIAALRIPPAWTGVVIAPQERANVQAVGQDAAGRWQYLYHPVQTARRERIKRDRLVLFIRHLPALRRAVARDLAQPGLGRRTVLAGVTRLLATCFLRPGSDEYASANGSFGLATLRPRHVQVRGDRIVLDFRGKSGKRMQREVRDRRVASLVRELLRHPGEVFKFRDDDGALRDVKRHHVNAYLAEVAGQRVTAKDFRTWAGSLLCACALAREAPAAAPRARRRQIAAAVREVAEHLGNTPAVCRASYVAPAVLRAYESGRRVARAFDDVASLARAGSRAVERAERALLALIAEHDAPARPRRASPARSRRAA